MRTNNELNSLADTVTKVMTIMARDYSFKSRVSESHGTIITICYDFDNMLSSSRLELLAKCLQTLGLVHHVYPYTKVIQVNLI